MNNLDFTAFRSISEIVSDLKKPIAIKHLEFLPKGGKHFPYISWTRACDYLDYFCPGWCYEITDRSEIGGKLILTVRISIPAKEGWFYKEATGQEDSQTDSWGDSSSNAESQALRRAAAKFGLAKYLYDISDAEKEGLRRGEQVSFPIAAPKMANGHVETGSVKEVLEPETATAPPEPVKAAETPQNGPETAPENSLDALRARVEKAKATIKALGYTPFEQGVSTLEKYFVVLSDQYKKCKAQPLPESVKAQGVKVDEPELNFNEKDFTPKPDESRFPADPIARSLSDLVTAKQLGMIRVICREQGIDPDEECMAVMDCKTDELSKKAASAFIEYLNEPPAETTETGKAITKNQMQILEDLARKTKTGMIDIVQEYTDGRSEVFEDMLESEADKAIGALTAKFKK